MGWTYQSFVTATSGGTNTCNVTLQATILSGDILVALPISSPAATLSTVPSGWIKVAGDRAAYKIADGTEDGTSASFVFSTAGGHTTRVIRATPASGSSSFTVAGAASSNTTPLAISLGSLSGDVFLVACCGVATIDTIAIPSGYTHIAATSASTNPSGRWAYKIQTGGTGDVSFSFSEYLTAHYGVLLAFTEDEASVATGNSFFFGDI